MSEKSSEQWLALIARAEQAEGSLCDMRKKHAAMCDRMMAAERKVHDLRGALWPFVDDLETRWSHRIDPTNCKEVYAEVELAWMRAARAVYYETEPHGFVTRPLPAVCRECGGTGELDSGAPDPRGNFIMVKCNHCDGYGTL